jgi:hypothetical protein
MRNYEARLLLSLLTFAVGVTAADAEFPRKTPTTKTLPASPPLPAAQTREAAFVERNNPTPRIAESVVVNFPTLGEVRARAVENFGEPVRMEFVKLGSDEVLAAFDAPHSDSDPKGFSPNSDVDFGNPFLRFKVLRIGGLPQPLILSVAVTPGGSDCGFYATVIGEEHGRLKVLTPEPLDTSILGGIHVGDLGGGRGVGAAVWSFIWDDGEGHYSEHRYEVKLYPFDSRRGRFVEGATLRTRGKHARREDALGELGLKYTDLLQDMPDVSERHQP